MEPTSNFRLEVWVLEDDPGCQFVYEEILKRDFDLRFFSSLRSFEIAMEERVQDPILVIADLLLDDGNFMGYLNREDSLEIFRSIPLIVVSSNDDVDALRLCFKRGASDYITKPFKRNELVVKIETILKNAKTYNKSIRPKIAIGDVLIDNLTGTQQKLLALFIESEGRTVDRDLIIGRVWGGMNVHPKAVDVHIYNLRRKLAEFGFIIRSERQGRWTLVDGKQG
jgi:DNA-binding response OmpR family regulator